MVKSLFLVLFACVVINEVVGETCGHDADCLLEHCAWGSHVACIKGICTCAEFCSNDQAVCQGRLECVQNSQQHGCSCDETWHCIDNHCACGYPNINSTLVH